MYCQLFYFGNYVLSVILLWELCIVSYFTLGIMYCQLFYFGNYVLSVILRWELCIVSYFTLGIMYCQLFYVGNYVLSVILLTLPEQLSSPSVVFSGVCVTRSLVLCVCFGDRCLSLSPRVANDICVPRNILRDTPDLSYVQPEGNYYFKTSDSYQILKSYSINISDCLKSPGTCDSSPRITTCKIKTDKIILVKHASC